MYLFVSFCMYSYPDAGRRAPPQRLLRRLRPYPSCSANPAALLTCCEYGADVEPYALPSFDMSLVLLRNLLAFFKKFINLPRPVRLPRVRVRTTVRDLVTVLRLGMFYSILYNKYFIEKKNNY